MCCGEYLSTPDIDGSQYYFDIDTGGALSGVTKPHMFMAVRLYATDIADDGAAVFFRAPSNTNANNIGS